MRANFLDAIKQLLPSGTAWNITNNTNLRNLFSAIAVLPEELRIAIENVYMDYFADSTRELDRWEKVFSVIFTRSELEQRRNVLFLEQKLWRSVQIFFAAGFAGDFPGNYCRRKYTMRKS